MPHVMLHNRPSLSPCSVKHLEYEEAQYQSRHNPASTRQNILANGCLSMDYLDWIPILNLCGALC